MPKAEFDQLEFSFEQPDLRTIFHRALRAITRKESGPEVEARFYPYAGLSSTIRLRNGRVYARVSDLLAHSPPEVLYALACILVAKLYRKRASKEYERVYREYTTRPSMLSATEEARRTRGYKLTSSPRGKIYDLEALFANLNDHYFGGKLERPTLSWSKQRTRRVLGHHDHVHNAITISRTLDSSRIPRFVVEYVLFHEMLHVKHRPQTVGGRTIYHGDQFRTEEKQFDRFGEALSWLERIAGPVRRRRKRTGGRSK